MGLVQLVIDDSTNKVIEGVYSFDRANGGILVVPADSSFPVGPVAGELIWRIDESRLYRRNDANTAWDATTCAVALHVATHQNGGTDELSVAGLSGVLADPQPAQTHASTHQNGGGDEISVAGLSGVLADAQLPQTHAIDGAAHSGSLAHSALSGITATDHHSNANDPTASQKAALNANATLSGTNRVVDQATLDAAVCSGGWRKSVDEIDVTPPGSPADSYRVLVGTLTAGTVVGIGTGAFAGHDYEIATWNAGLAQWIFEVPVDGWRVTDKESDADLIQKNTAAPWLWETTGGATAIHGNEKHSPSMLTVGGNRSDANLNTLTGGGTTALHSHAPVPAVLASQTVTATGTITTTSGTYVLATGMTITPAAGTYLCFFTGACWMTTADATRWINLAIFDDGVIVPGAAVSNGDGVGFLTPFCVVGVCTVNGSQAIEGRWNRVAGGGTASMRETRTLTIVKIG